jgi:hypothetical protein
MLSKLSSNLDFIKRITNGKRLAFFALVIFVLGFVIGVIGIRYDYIKNFYYFSKDVPKLINHVSSMFNRNFSNFETISIDMKFEEYQLLTSNRVRNIEEGHGVYYDKDWAKGKITFDSTGMTSKADIRLKGTMSDNWIRKDGKWSFRVELKGENRYEGLKEFSFFRPSSASGILEWVFQKIALQEELLDLHTQLVKLNLNGNDLGYYYLQEHFDKLLIENNNRREGPIVGYNKDRIVKLWNSDRTNILDTDGFQTADITITGNYDKLSIDQKRMADYAIGSLESLRSNKISPSSIIDEDSIAKLLAIRAIIGSSELDWKDIKFYYNPLTSMLEPIVREAHAEYDIDDWWYRGTRPVNSRFTKHSTFEDLIFSDEKIFNKYIYFLRTYLYSDIIGSVIKNNQKDFNKIIGAMALTNDALRWLEATKTRNKKIRAALTYPNPISATISNSGVISVRNFQYLPVSIKNIFVDGKTLYENDINWIAYERSGDEKHYDTKFPLELNDINEGAKVELVFLLFGSELRSNVEVQRYSPKANLEFNDELYKIFFYEEKGKLFNRKSKTYINSTIVTPKGLKVIFTEGSEIIFQSKGQLIVLGGIELNGSSNSRIKVDSSMDANNGGIYVLESSNDSLIKFSDFANLRGVYLDNSLITGGLVFYKSKVSIIDSTFIDNLKTDDYINIVNSEFNIENVEIKNSFADSLDVDFSNGHINNLLITNSGNDGLDFSGSRVLIESTKIQNSSDKAISIGENSIIEAKNIIVTDSFIGVAVKDGSTFNADFAFTENNNYDYASFVKKIAYGKPTLTVQKDDGDFSYILGKNANLIINGVEVLKKTDNVRELLY